MTEPSKSRAAGAPIAFLLIAGVAIGAVMGEPSIGFLIGLALGVALALLLWWRDGRG